MTNKEAIQVLTTIALTLPHTGDIELDYKVNQAFDLAIKALKREVSWEEDNAHRERLFGQLSDYKE